MLIILDDDEPDARRMAALRVTTRAATIAVRQPDGTYTVTVSATAAGPGRGGAVPNLTLEEVQTIHEQDTENAS